MNRQFYVRAYISQHVELMIDDIYMASLIENYLKISCVYYRLSACRGRSFLSRKHTVICLIFNEWLGYLRKQNILSTPNWIKVRKILSKRVSHSKYIYFLYDFQFKHNSNTYNFRSCLKHLTTQLQKWSKCKIYGLQSTERTNSTSVNNSTKRCTDTCYM